ncbi:hypothetical protein VOLCADRAFT_121465 [Volvox carteri f. nagariensis]|uniref:Amine oxidase domain-containing protein n=1 Tax=Volvox carteri f. nagariensis TaxID=3068 RepID=D8UAY1_VOLCA|nr:uncharacterized protein VOLCADRAFT_121465 [Volvox carteri f. nagariensis]EFJ43014.1 hypothetical protein VOLCADRAFT_121465 [Volvox carteri f. nagariensis]|eukprot:XP_002955813.1 hypothetical protein VOLCADRAFT_121465 [Volvox carteri f. nagariensis]
MHCVRNVSRVCRQAHATPSVATVAPCPVQIKPYVRCAASGSALVVGGGFAGLAAADVLATAGLDVVLVEQGRGLGGRMCTRTVTLGSHGERLTFDHGCQYLTARTPLFGAVLGDLHDRGAVAQWGLGRPVGAAHLAEDGTVDMSTFVADTGKTMWVGNPTNSAVGRALAARVGSQRLAPLTAVRVDELVWNPEKNVWTCRARRAGAINTGGGGGGTDIDAAVANSSGGSGGSHGSGDGDGAESGLVPELVAAAREIRSNVCWALLVALNKKIDVPFDGALLSRPDASGGAMAQYGPIAWVARDSSKPGRPAVAGGAGEAWVVHAAPEWSNLRRDVAPADVAAELLRDFAHLVQTDISPADVIHQEVHRWNNAYPLNPRPPNPPEAITNSSSSSSSSRTRRHSSGTSGGGGGGEVQLQPPPPLAGHFMLRPDIRLGVCGDWCKGPRAANAYMTGWEAATAVLLQL